MTSAPTTLSPTRRPGGILALFRPDPPADVILEDPQQVRAGYRHWQPRILVASIVGYAMFYFVRKNLSIAMPVMGKQLHIGKEQLGLFLTLHGVLYGVSKFANGFLGDRANARTFMATGLFLSALVNIAFGSASIAFVMGILWLLNGWFQGMGFPPCARLLTHWFPPRQLATKMSIWNTSHSIGAGLVVILCGYLVVHDWRLCFYVPAALAIATSIYLLIFLRDTPESLGLPPVEHLDTNPGFPVITSPAVDAGAVPPPDVAPPEIAAEAAAPPAPAAGDPTYGYFLRRYVFSNPYIWLVSLANFFVYTIRYAVLDWGPTLLSEAKGIRLTHTGWIMAAFEGFGLLGALAAGWMTDRFFAGRATRACVFYMLACAATLYVFWRLPHQSEFASTAILCAAGFFVYGPQCLIGVAAANLATKRAAAAAVGLTGIFGYASTVLSGWGLGYLVQHYGWDRGFLAIFIIAIVGILLFVLAWPAPAHGYSEQEGP